MIVLLVGENEFSVSKEQHKLVAEYLLTNDSYGLERLDGEDLEIDRLRDAVLQLPFLVSKKLVVITRPFAKKQLSDQLVEVMPQIPEQIDVVMVDAKADKRTKLYKELASKKMVKEFATLKGQGLEAWVREYSAEQGSDISSADANLLIERIGPDQMRLAREIEKLSYVPTITKTEIVDLTDPSLQASVFDLLDKTFAGKKKSALALYDELIANKTDPNEVLSLLGWQLHAIALIKYAGEGSSNEIASMVGLHPYVVGKSMYTARGLSVAQIKQGVASALATDIAIKTSATDASDAVKVLLLELSSA